MKIQKDYLTILSDTIKNTKEDELNYSDVINKVICFERSDFIDACIICNAFNNEKALDIYSEQLVQFDNGVIPNTDFFDWCDGIEWNVGRGKHMATKGKVRERVKYVFHNENFKQGEDIKCFVASITNMIWFKQEARKKINGFAKKVDLEPDAVETLLEVVGVRTF